MHQRGHGRDVDDLAFAFFQQWQESLAALDHAHQVDRDLPVPVLQGQLTEEPARRYTRVIDDDIDAAEFDLAGLGERCQLAVIAYVAALDETVAARFADQLEGFLQAGLADVRQGQLPAFTRPAQRDFATQARACTSDHHAILHSRQPCCSRKMHRV
ncbi:hypothetical protein D3C78_1137190 [compost metagenome]